MSLETHLKAWNYDDTHHNSYDRTFKHGFVYPDNARYPGYYDRK
ncbi:hypothetical protein HanXRQr2_Chr09g0394401 [Helianthus annuus]|uniref:Uncharacterized protein n=1 Tax=Helianthus annuus TaxID=4232 RepID=A0A9K3N8Z9_HELAN|nr:hypothetical protein HanXRQr2_Chr09g0394401 [Helianthus annuus]KAJ0893656.1 hypothetical protein HanPSC8_Chr09g0380261 [Helianthus annuus]